MKPRNQTKPHEKTIWLVLLLIAIPIFGDAQQVYSTNDLKNGKYKDDSSYIYTLPFEAKKKLFLIQGYESMFSHKGGKALDFKVKSGTKICAARNGIVTATREDSDKRGLRPENLSDGNYILIQHKDGSVAYYWHFQKQSVLVNVGDTIEAGQLIGLSGNTGYSAFPHLHFEVRGNDVTGNFVQLPTRFYTKDGIQYLRAGYFYKRRF